MPQKNLLIFPDVEKAVDAVADAFSAAAAKANQSGKSFNVVLSGGSTPEKLFRILAKRHKANPLSWSHVHFFWGDERMVPPDDQQSNFRMANEALLKHLPLEPSQIHRIRGEEDPVGEVERLTSDTKTSVETNEAGMPVFDWIFLGMGGDGHTASLFPHADTVQNLSNIWTLAKHPESGQIRISLTLPAINAAKHIVFLVFGAEKATMLNRVLYSPLDKKNLPAAMVDSDNGRLDWYIDEAATAELSDLISY